MIVFRLRYFLFWPFAYQHFLLPYAGFLVGSMNAVYPRAGAFLTVNPTNKFVSGDRSQFLPDTCDFFCLGHRFG